MSELKYYKLFHRTSALTSPEFISIVEFGNGDEVYLKSEADKVIAYHKYKRCLAMAEICRHEWCTMYYERKKYSENKFLDYLMSKKDRHKNKWLELAEKFKEA